MRNIPIVQFRAVDEILNCDDDDHGRMKSHWAVLSCIYLLDILQIGTSALLGDKELSFRIISSQY